MRTVEQGTHGLMMTGNNEKNIYFKILYKIIHCINKIISADEVELFFVFVEHFNRRNSPGLSWGSIPFIKNIRVLFAKPQIQVVVVLCRINHFRKVVLHRFYNNPVFRTMQSILYGWK